MATAPNAPAPSANAAIAVGPRRPGPRASSAVARTGRRSIQLGSCRLMSDSPVEVADRRASRSGRRESTRDGSGEVSLEEVQDDLHPLASVRRRARPGELVALSGEADHLDLSLEEPQ